MPSKFNPAWMLYGALLTSQVIAQEQFPTEGQFWQRIDAIARKVRFGTDAVLDAWPMRKELLSREDTPYSSSLHGGTVSLTSDIIVRASELRIAKGEPARLGLAVLDIDGRCITVGEVKRHYPDIRISDVPRTASPRDRTYWTTTGVHGRISFGFANRRRDCLDGIVFNPGNIRPHTSPPD